MKTRGDSMLDFILIPSLLEKKISVTKPIGNSDHNSLLATLLLRNKIKRLTLYTWNKKHAVANTREAINAGINPKDYVKSSPPKVKCQVKLNIQKSHRDILAGINALFEKSLFWDDFKRQQSLLLKQKWELF